MKISKNSVFIEGTKLYEVEWSTEGT